MGYNLNSLSGMLALYCIGGSTACFPAVFIFKANNDPMAGAIFTIIGSVFLALGAILLYMSRDANEYQEGKRSQLFMFLLLLNIITAVVMYILSETIRF
ncbi:MAG: hypothetical protein INQ03_20045 [Candidatus Heimdallarchaeota archaeon]|nr:hypothetical protein [Candidatus Heimdallarchaeota archaeon]